MLHSLRDHHALAHQALQKVADRQNSSKQKRRSFLKGGLASLLLISGAGAVWQFKQPGYSEAFETAKGKKSRHTLPDGTEITLNTDSQVEVSFYQTKRAIHLIKGEVLISTGTDSSHWFGARTLQVDVNGHVFEPVGTRFILRRESGDSVLLHVTEGAVRIRSQSNTTRIAKSRESFEVNSSHQIERQWFSHLKADGWTSGVLEVESMNLGQFVQELQRYTEMDLQVAPQAAGLKVSGVFQIKNHQSVIDSLSTLERTLPVKLSISDQQIQLLNTQP